MMIRRQTILLIALLIVGCASTKPPIATFYLGMTEEEFNKQNKDKIVQLLDSKDGFITKGLRASNTQSYFDGDDPWSRNAYIYEFRNDTLISVRTGIISLSKEIDYTKYPGSKPE